MSGRPPSDADTDGRVVAPAEGSGPEGSGPDPRPVDACVLDRLVILARERGGIRPVGGAEALRARFASDAGPLPISRVLAAAAVLGLSVCHRRVGWSALPGLADRLPGLMIFRDRSTAILDGLLVGPAGGTGSGTDPAAVLIREERSADPAAEDFALLETRPLALDAEDLAPLWDGEMILIEDAGDPGRA